MEDQSQTIGGFQEAPTMITLQPVGPAITQQDPPTSRQPKLADSIGNEPSDSDQMTIARRTRSQLSISDFVLVDNLDFPDVDRRLYQNADSEGDTEYKDFCRHLYGSTNESTTDANTDDNDPPYIFNDHIFSPGWRFDLDEELQQQEAALAASFANHDNNLMTNSQTRDATNITANNNNLDVDLENRAHRIDLCDSFSDQNLAVSSLSTAPGFKSPNKHGRRKIDMFNEPEFRRVLDQQLRQHIQLLTQTYLLTKNTTNMQGEANEAKGYLFAYMKIFKNKSKPSNLLPAIELVNSYGSSRDIKSYVRLSWRHLPIPETVKTILNTRRDIFMYANLLPEVAFSLLPEKLVAKKAKIIFTPNEDKLLAYALNEFKGETSQYAYIASLLMAAKTKMQISNHIKNIKRSPGNEDHPVKRFFSHGQLPPIDLDADVKIRDVRALSEECDASEEDDEEEEEEEEEHQEEMRDERKCDEQVIITRGEVSNADKFPQVVKGPDVRLSETGPQGVEIGEQKDEEPQQRAQSQHVAQISNFQVVEHETDNVIKQHFEFQHQQQLASPQRDPSPEPTSDDLPAYLDHDEMMNMDLDDLMAASTTISKNIINFANGGNNNNINSSNISERNIKNLKLRSSMLELLSNQFSISQGLGDLMIEDFINASKSMLSERDYLHLLQLLTDLMRKEAKRADSQMVIYNEISAFMSKIETPSEIRERLVLFLNLDQATKCGCAFSYLHWMRFFEFIHHVGLHHEGDAIEKKLTRLIDAIQKDDSHKVKLAVANLINKHPLLKREFDSLELDGKPHPSLFLCDEDFDDITEPMAIFHSRESTDSIGDKPAEMNLFDNESFELKPTSDENNFATPLCPCGCHQSQQINIAPNNVGDQHSVELGQHCNKCNLKFMKGRMYLVNKIKPFLAEWSYAPTPPPSEASTSSPVIGASVDSHRTQSQPVDHPITNRDPQEPQWTFEEDKEILEFCRAKAELNDENISFDASTFEELIKKRGIPPTSVGDTDTHKRSAREIAERFNQLMEMYRMDGS